MQTWQEVTQWRRALRTEFLAKREALAREEKERVRDLLRRQLPKLFPELRAAVIGFYWPIRSEIDLTPLLKDCLEFGAKAALPVVVEKQKPLEFWNWHPKMKLARGFWNIPIPPEAAPVQPTALLVPLVGFDIAGYRLGYGGGYYDRTLASFAERPLTIGVGFELGRLDTIHPQPHDIPLDAIVTETSATRYRYRGKSLPGGSFASPPCFLHELEGD